MAFLFNKNKKPITGLPPANRKLTSADGSNAPSSSSLMGVGNESTSATGSTNSPLLQRVASPTPDSNRSRMDVMQSPNQRAMPVTAQPSRAQPDPSLYPWSQQRLEFVSAQANPFPRYGAATNSLASRDGDVYMIGGLVNGTNVKGDLWIVEAGEGPLSCYPVQTTAEGPGPRVGHAALLVGNAFIVFGGDTKVEENDVLDDTLYLLNTSTKHWSRALPPGQRPSGRYGHTLNIMGSKIYIFGGQVEGYFFNDLVAFDLNALQQANSRWEVLVPNNPDGPPVQGGQIPQARTNHTVVTWNDKLVLFGGTDGNRWFNDVWIYDPRTNIWANQECIGYIPFAREGHASALVGDVMYVLGGRTEDGKDLGDLAAFRITTRRWYTFQNMGPSPSPRSGHGMTAYGNKIVILGGEPSTAPREPAELSLAYILDTTKIKYPIDNPAPRSLTSRRPSVTDRSQTPSGDRSASRQGMREPRDAGNGRAKRQGSQESLNSMNQYQRSLDSNASERPVTNGIIPDPSRGLPVGQSPTSPQGFQSRNGAARPTVDIPDTTRSMSRQGNYSMRQGDDATAREPTSPTSPIVSPIQAPSAMQRGQYTPKQSFDDGPRELPGSMGTYRQTPHAAQGSVDSINSSLANQPAPNGIARQAMQNASQPKQPQYQDSSSASSFAPAQRNDDLLKDLENARSKNAWYASELSLARKAGYRPSSADGHGAERDGETFAENEKPLVEALLKMKGELARVQEALATQSKTAGERIAQVQKERDAALHEAVYAKTRTRGTRGIANGVRDTPTPDSDRIDDVHRRLASTLASHNELSQRHQLLSAELEAERKARQIAQESADAAHSRALELDTHKQESVSELERLRKDLHEAQLQAREASSNHHEAKASAEMLQIDKNELSAKLDSAQETIRNHGSVLTSLRDAVAASTERSNALERKLEEHKQHRTSLEEQLTQLRTEHSARQASLDTATARSRDLEDEVTHHKEEARTHREAVLAGLGRLTETDSHVAKANDERIVILQQRLDAANAMMRRNQAAADQAAEKLRRAEERIAGLESYQEQTSREGLTLRKQVQESSREALTLRSQHAELQQQLSTHKLNSTALQVQHGALRGLLSDRGIDPSDTNREIGGSDGVGSHNTARMAELEAQLTASTKAHEDMRTSFERREMEANRGWEDKLAALDSDYQSAVKYLKGTEKMLSKMKQELHRYKSQNRELEDEIVKTRSTTAATSGSRELVGDVPHTAQFEEERNTLRAELNAMQGRLTSSVTQLESQMSSLRSLQAERDEHKTASESLQRELASNRSDVESLRAQNNTLEARAAEAEKKIQLLLDTVGSTVNNYRRTSQSAEGMLNGAATGGSSGGVFHATGHNRDFSTASIGNESLYGGGPGDAIPASETMPSHPSSMPQHMMSERDLSSGGAHHQHSLSRNSLALDNLASELESLRSHWETTANKHRLSDRSVDLGHLDMSHMSGEPGPVYNNAGHADDVREQVVGTQERPRPSEQAPLSASMAEWRKKLDLGDEDGSQRESGEFPGEHGSLQGSIPGSVPGSAGIAPPMYLPGYGAIGQGQTPYSQAHAAGQAQGQMRERGPSGQSQGQGEHTLRPQLSNMRGQSGSASEPSNEMDIA